MIEKTIKRKFVYRGKMINLRVDKVVLSEGTEAQREIVEHPGAVAVVPVLPDGKIILVKQYRKPVKKALLEIPAGKLEKGEGAKACAMRELEEETGFRAGKMRKVLEYFPSPGYSNERIHIFEATQLKKSMAKHEDDELIQVSFLTFQEILELIKQGKIKDGKTIIALLLKLPSPLS